MKRNGRLVCAATNVSANSALTPGAPSERVVSSPALGRKEDPVAGLFADIDPQNPPAGWTMRDNRYVERDGTRVIDTTVTDPQGRMGSFQRAYHPGKKKLEMRAAFLGELPGWIDTGGTPLVAGRGMPTHVYVTLYQMKQLGAGYGAVEKVKMSTIQNMRTIMQMHVAKAAGIDPDVAVLGTHSVEYARTSIVQSGHQIVSAHVAGAPTKGSLGDLMVHYEARDPSLVATHDKWIQTFGKGKIDRSTVVEWDFDIELEVAPFGGAP